jgi:peptidyl-prolyl cis-trans isomerase-like protein 2
MYYFIYRSIIPYVKKYKKNPVTGEDLKMNELTKLNFSKNENGEYQDPISFKIFTDHMHIVAIKTSGNVYSAATVDKLNREAKYWKDLVSGEEFTHKDIITLQDPKHLEKRTIKNFDYIRNNIDVEIKDKGTEAFINKNEATKNVLSKF